MIRAASSLAGTGISITAWEVRTTLRVAKLAADFAVRTSADLAERAGRAIGGPGPDVPRGLAEEMNRALVMRLHRAMVEADLVTAKKLFADDVRWRIPSPAPMAGEYRGKAAVAGALASVWRLHGSVSSVEIRDVLASAERAGALLRLSVMRLGEPATLDGWMTLRIDGGEVVEAWGPFIIEPARTWPG